jgi:hypothetical protein
MIVRWAYDAAMASWADFEAGATAMARGGRAVLYRSGEGEGMFATLRGDGLPRIHVVNVAIVGGRLLVFVQDGSAKTRDLLEDGRYALHGMQDPAAPHEFLVRGRARLVTDESLRAEAKAVWPFRPSDEYPLFELDVEHALFGYRASADDWPPRYESWRSG